MSREKIPNLKILSITVVIAAVAIGIFAFQSLRGEVGRGLPKTKILEVNSIPVSVKSFNGKARANLKKTFDDVDDLDQYITARKAKLEEMVASDPDRKIEVVISSVGMLSLEDMKEKAGETGLAINEMGLDLYVDGQWSRMAQFDGSSTVVDPAWSEDEILEKLRQIEETQTPGTRPGIRPAPFTSVGIRFARGTVGASQASDLQSDAAILLVDPLTDLTDQLRPEYGEVKIGDVVQVFVLKELHFGQRYKPVGPTRSDRQ